MRLRSEEGSAVVEFAWLGILLLLPLLWIVMSVFEVQKGAFGVSAGARAAARAYALAPTDADGLRRAEAAARQALADQGLQDAPLDVTVTCQSPTRDCHAGTSVITVTISSRVDLALMPKFLGGNKPSFALDASHTVPIGQFQEIE